jgi:hypothetical protein
VDPPLRQRFFPDYNAAAALYWSGLTAVGLAVTAWAAFRLVALPPAQLWQVLGIVLVAVIGVTTLIVALPMVVMFQATLHYYFGQQEAAEREAIERSNRERAEAAQETAAA